MESDKAEEPIFDLARECETLFAQQATKLHGCDEQNGAKLLLELNQRFLAWAAFLGVFAESNACLDRKLRHHVEIQDQVLLLLDIMRRNLAYLFDPDQPSDPMDVDSNDNRKLSPQAFKLSISSLEAVAEAVDRLNHLGIAIRRSSVVSQGTRARAYAERFDLNSFEKVSYLSLQALYPDASQGLLEQLARSMTETYARFLHRKSRQERLQTRRQHVQIPDRLYQIVEDEAVDIDQEMQMSATKTMPEPGTDISTPMLQASRPQFPRALPLSEPTSIDSKEVRARFQKLLNPSIKSKTKSILVNQIDYPRPARGSLICDWCFSPVPVDSTEGDRWRQHVNEDNEPYICLSENCSETLPKFATSTQWFQHMLTTHGHNWHQEAYAPSSWVCPLCTDEEATFSKSHDLTAHLDQVHEGTFTEPQIQAITNQSRFQVPRSRDVCPLCCLSIRGQQFRQSEEIENESNMPNSKLIGSHIAAHLQSIMLLALRLISIDVAVDVSNDNESTTNGTDDRSSWTGSGQAGLGEKLNKLETLSDFDNVVEVINDDMSTGSDQTMPDAIPDIEYIDWDSLRLENFPENPQEQGFRPLDNKNLLTYRCLLCPPTNILAGTEAFAAHVRQQHQPIQTFKCMVCDYKTPLPDNLRRHLRINHSRKLSREEILVNEALEPVPLVCSICVSQGLELHTGPFNSWYLWFEKIKSHCIIDHERRWGLIEKLLLSEQTFILDMRIVQDIYQSRFHEACPQIGSADRKILFGNCNKILEFSSTFLVSLQEACRTVFTITDPKKTNFDNNDEQSSNLSAFEMDQKTRIGRTFIENVSWMEEAFGKYSKRHDASQKKLHSLLKDYPEVKKWLQECSELHGRTTNDQTIINELKHLLERPTQRLDEYSLFLSQLEKCTPNPHPDREAIIGAQEELASMRRRIAAMKRKTDTVTRILHPMEKESGFRAAFSKVLNRRTEVSESTASQNLPSIPEDRPHASPDLGRRINYTVQELQERFGDNHLRLQVVVKDFQKYTTELRGMLEAFKDLARSFTRPSDGQILYISLSAFYSIQKPLEEGIERLFHHHHVDNLEDRVLNPILSLFDVYDQYRKALEEHKKRSQESTPGNIGARFGIGEKLSDRTEQFLALDQTLRDELPKLFLMTGKLVRACLEEFVHFQEHWYRSFEKFLEEITKIKCTGVQDIINDWRAKTSKPFSEISKLGICNGSILRDSSVRIPSPVEVLDSKDDTPETSQRQTMETTSTIDSALSSNFYEDTLAALNSEIDPAQSPSDADEDTLAASNSETNPAQSLPDANEDWTSAKVLFMAASLFEFQLDRTRYEAGYPFLTYSAGEIFDVLVVKDELWLARNQDDAAGQVGWIWDKHFAKISE